ncbi:MAG TPA: Na+/H+ antiporter [Dehalococcoidia bacterium]|jgi:CPA1 family monovalent cation:H+ antiporter
MHAVVFVLVALAVVAALIPLANRLAVPYPIVLVVGGLVLGLVFALVPALPTIRLEPDLVFLLFLPPLLYWEAVTTSWRDFRANLRPITSLAVGLVVFTTCGVAFVARTVIGLPWAVDFVLGAVVSSTDVVAAITVTSRLGVPRRVVTVLTGEGLVNDATALVVYGAAVTAVVAGRFSLAEASLHFVVVSAGGVAIGLSAGWVLIQLRRRISDTRVEETVALLTPFAAYLPADLLGVSGVLAAVAAGLYVGRRSPVVISSAIRLRADAVWELGTFLLNGLVFILIGVEFQGIWRELSGDSLAVLLRDVALISLTVIVIRLAWVFPAGGLVRLANRRWGRGEEPLPAAALGVIGWAGMRGVISLATALALPVRAGGNPFPNRELLIFLAVGVIAVTLIGQGLTLAPLIRWLRLGADETSAQEEQLARLAVARAALEQLDSLATRDGFSVHALHDLRRYYTYRIEQLESTTAAPASEHARAGRDPRGELIEVERRTLIDLRNRNVISDEVLRRIQRELDLEQVRFEVRAPRRPGSSE